MESLKKEGLERLKILEKRFGLMKNCRKEFEQDDNLLYYAEKTQLGGMLYWVSNRDDLMEQVEKFEKENNVRVYFCLLTYTDFGTLFDMLYVSNEKEYWENERENLSNGFVISNCKNLTDDFLSEFGTIKITGQSGGVVRVG